MVRDGVIPDIIAETSDDFTFRDSINPGAPVLHLSLHPILDYAVPSSSGAEFIFSIAQWLETCKLHLSLVLRDGLVNNPKCDVDATAGQLAARTRVVQVWTCSSIHGTPFWSNIA
ncbi:hypothetical protein CHU98_g2044 [Xylaria longipes]|nr:hypothetical protein CHU98_g2044 [Xylaria longipes]